MRAAIMMYWFYITANMQREIEFLGDGSKDHPPSDEGRFFLQMFSQFFLGMLHSLYKGTYWQD